MITHPCPPEPSDYDISLVRKEKFDQNIPSRQEKNQNVGHIVGWIVQCCRSLSYPRYRLCSLVSHAGARMGPRVFLVTSSPDGPLLCYVRIYRDRLRNNKWLLLNVIFF